MSVEPREQYGEFRKRFGYKSVKTLILYSALDPAALLDLDAAEEAEEAEKGRERSEREVGAAQRRGF